MTTLNSSSASALSSSAENLSITPDPHPFFHSDKLIVVEGPIGVGKSSLTRLLADRWRADGHYETFEANPFLTTGFYEDKDAFAFNTEIFFLLTRVREQRALREKKGLQISDYLFDKNLIFASLNLSGPDLDIYQNLYQQVLPEIRKPDLVIVLKADLESLMRRIYFRDRHFERSISPHYLENLMKAYYQFFSNYTEAPVVHVQTTGLDFVNDPQDFQRVVSLVEERIQGYQQLSLRSRMKGASRV